nr:MAG TPA: hypothetical protein [Bacteriophage sp.]
MGLCLRINICSKHQIPVRHYLVFAFSHPRAASFRVYHQLSAVEVSGIRSRIYNTVSDDTRPVYKPCGSPRGRHKWLSVFLHLLG